MADSHFRNRDHAADKPAHDHDHVHDHTHAHSHGPAAPHPPQAAPWSLLRMTLLARVGGAVVISAALWAVVLTAMR